MAACLTDRFWTLEDVVALIDARNVQKGYNRVNSLLRVIAGLILPIRLTGRLYLADRLSIYGVPRGHVPKACLQELADEAIASSKSISAMMREPWRSRITEDLDGRAVNIAKTIFGTFESPAYIEEYWRDVVENILRRYNVAKISN